MAPSLKFQTLNLWLTSQPTCPLLPTLPPFDLHTCCSFSWVASTPSPSLLSSLLGRCRKSVPRPDLPNTLSGHSRCFENYDIVGGNSLPCPWSQLEVSWELCFVSQLLSHICFCVTLLAILVCCRSFDYFFVLFCLCGFFFVILGKGTLNWRGSLPCWPVYRVFSSVIDMGETSPLWGVPILSRQFRLKYKSQLSRPWRATGMQRSSMVSAFIAKHRTLWLLHTHTLPQL